VGEAARGTLPGQAIARLVESGVVRPAGLPPDQIQPASLDLTLGAEAWSLPGSVLPLPGERVEDLLGRFARRRLHLAAPQILVRGEVYVVRLREALRLPPRLAAYANGKSSIGRIDVQTRVLTDGTPRYDKVAPGYSGDLFLEIIPKSFDVTVRAGDSLNQVIFHDERQVLEGAELRRLHAGTPLLYDQTGEVIDVADPRHGQAAGGVMMTLDLEQPIAGWVAKKSWRPVDLAGLGAHDPRDFFEPIPRPREGALFLSREAFYIFSTAERVAVPPEFAVEMLPYDTSAGEFRAHYAGFFDPGFGWGEAGELRGTPAVLEVRPYEDDLLVRHRQPVCKMAFERLAAPPERLYGQSGNHYATQRGPRLSKFFAEAK
jgi:dCTP deaminase